MRKLIAVACVALTMTGCGYHHGQSGLDKEHCAALSYAASSALIAGKTYEAGQLNQQYKDEC